MKKSTSTKRVIYIFLSALLVVASFDLAARGEYLILVLSMPTAYFLYDKARFLKLKEYDLFLERPVLVNTLFRVLDEQKIINKKIELFVKYFTETPKPVTIDYWQIRAAYREILKPVFRSISDRLINQEDAICSLANSVERLEWRIAKHSQEVEKNSIIRILQDDLPREDYLEISKFIVAFYSERVTDDGRKKYFNSLFN